MRRIATKLNSTDGVSRLVAILLAAVLAGLCAAAVPAYRAYAARAEEYGCALALKKAQDLLDEEYMLNGYTAPDEETARAAVERSMMGRAELCPAGGEYYIVYDGAGRATVVCGVHAEDLKLRTRLNAAHVLDLLRAAVAEDRLYARGDPDSVDVTLNGEKLTARRTEQETGLRRGTFSTGGYEGTVAFYMLDAEGVGYFSFADEDYCANWARGAGWTGDSYS